MLLKLLAARGIAVTASQCNRIAGASLDQLERWLDQVDACTNADELT
jgi:hypothetical protein